MSKTKQGLSLEELERDAWPHNPEEVSTVEWQIPEDKEKCSKNVNELKHYNQGGIQPIHFITSNGMTFSQGNAIKYLTRFRYKNKEEDLTKAITYALFLLRDEYGAVSQEFVDETMRSLTDELSKNLS